MESLCLRSLVLLLSLNRTFSLFTCNFRLVVKLGLSKFFTVSCCELMLQPVSAFNSLVCMFPSCSTWNVHVPFNVNIIYLDFSLQVTNVIPNTAASRCKFSLQAQSLTGKLVPWVVTEINCMPVNLFCKEKDDVSCSKLLGFFVVCYLFLLECNCLSAGKYLANPI